LQSAMKLQHWVHGSGLHQSWHEWKHALAADEEHVPDQHGGHDADRMPGEHMRTHGGILRSAGEQPHQTSS
jgi:hypothetical protein